jgi:hypothetical protein
MTSAQVRGEWSVSRPGRFTPGTHWIGDWVDPRASLDDVEKRKFLTLLGPELDPLAVACRFVYSNLHCYCVQTYIF